MAPNAQKIRVLRVLCREDFSMQSAESFVDDLKQALSWLDGHFIYTPQQLKALQMSMKWQGVARRAVKACLPAGYLQQCRTLQCRTLKCQGKQSKGLESEEALLSGFAPGCIWFVARKPYCGHQAGPDCEQWRWNG